MKDINSIYRSLCLLFLFLFCSSSFASHPQGSYYRQGHRHWHHGYPHHHHTRPKQKQHTQPEQKKSKRQEH